MKFVAQDLSFCSSSFVLVFLSRTPFSSVLLDFGGFRGLETDWDGEKRARNLVEHIYQLAWSDSSQARSYGILRKVEKTPIPSRRIQTPSVFVTIFGLDLLGAPS
jgi:hypothetical protein